MLPLPPCTQYCNERNNYMTVRDCYQALGGSYEDVLSRFRTEDRIKKYIFKFLNDQSFQSLERALAVGGMEDAFRAAHTLKGVVQNLGFDRLAESTHLITEALRAGDSVQATSLFTQLSMDYNVTISSIQNLLDSE